MGVLYLNFTLIEYQRQLKIFVNFALVKLAPDEWENLFIIKAANFIGLLKISWFKGVTSLLAMVQVVNRYMVNALKTKTWDLR